MSKKPPIVIIDNSPIIQNLEAGGLLLRSVFKLENGDGVPYMWVEKGMGRTYGLPDRDRSNLSLTFNR